MAGKTKKTVARAPRQGRRTRGARLRPRREKGRRTILEMVCGADVKSTAHGPEEWDLASELLDRWCAEKGYEREPDDRTGTVPPAEVAAPLAVTSDVAAPGAQAPEACAVPEMPHLDSTVAEAVAWFLAKRRPIEATANARAWRTFAVYGYRLRPVLERLGQRLVREVDQALVNDYASWHSRQLLRHTQLRLAREAAGFVRAPMSRPPTPPRRVKASTVVEAIRILRRVVIAVFEARNYAFLPAMTVPEGAEEPNAGPLSDPEIVRLLRACHGLVWDHATGTWAREPDMITCPDTGEREVRRIRVRDPATGAVREVEAWRYKRRRTYIVERRVGGIRLIVAALGTGSRSTVVRTATWDRRPEGAFVDERLEILHRRGFVEKDGKTKRHVPVKLLHSLREHLRRWREEDARYGITHVVHQANGAPMSNGREYFAAIARDAGLPHVSLHHLRHTTIARLIELGLPMNQIAKFVGSSVATIDKHYDRLNLGQDRAVELLDGRGRRRRRKRDDAVQSFPAAAEAAGMPAGHPELDGAVGAVLDALRAAGDLAAIAAFARIAATAGLQRIAPATPIVDPAAAPPPDVAGTGGGRDGEVGAATPAEAAVEGPAAAPSTARAGTAVERAGLIILSRLTASEGPVAGAELNRLVMADGLSLDRAEQAKVRLKRHGTVVRVPGNLWSLPGRGPWPGRVGHA